MGRAATPSIGLGSLGRKLSRTVGVAVTTTIAWVFGFATAGVLVYLAMGLYTGESMFASPILLLDPADVSRPVGLSFAGMTGAYIAVGMAAGVMLVLAMSMMFNSGMRKLGLLAMVGWSGLWAYNAVLMVIAGWKHGAWTGDQRVLAAALVLVAVVGCMLHRMIRCWRVRVSM
jgi:hypothetical protein